MAGLFLYTLDEWDTGAKDFQTAVEPFVIVVWNQFRTNRVKVLAARRRGLLLNGSDPQKQSEPHAESA
jgi:hypothetical protein